MPSLSPRHVDNPYEPIPERPTTRIASASFISKCYLGRVDFLRLVHRSRHLSPLLFSLKSPSLRLPTGELVTKVFFISSSTSSTKLPTLSCPQVSGSSYTWDGVTWHTATYTARNKVLVAIFKTKNLAWTSTSKPLPNLVFKVWTKSWVGLFTGQ